MTNDEKVRSWAELAHHDGDEEAAQAIEALIMERDVERAMREERERLLACERSMHGTTAAALRQAVAERDEARAAHAATREEVTAQVESRERAEADNAVQLDDISEAAILLREGHDPAKAGQVLAGVLIAGRRGSALLEYVRALEQVRKAVESYRLDAAPHVEANDGSTREEVLVRACAVADGLSKKASDPDVVSGPFTPYWVRIAESILRDTSGPMRCECGWSGTVEDGFTARSAGAFIARRVSAECPACGGTVLWVPSPHADLYRRVEKLESLVQQLLSGVAR